MPVAARGGAAFPALPPQLCRTPSASAGRAAHGLLQRSQRAGVGSAARVNSPRLPCLGSQPRRRGRAARGERSQLTPSAGAGRCCQTRLALRGQAAPARPAPAPFAGCRGGQTPGSHQRGKRDGDCTQQVAGGCKALIQDERMPL
ncbi:unnamed protein product [Eretmochelys imbricata]